MPTSERLAQTSIRTLPHPGRERLRTRGKNRAQARCRRKRDRQRQIAESFSWQRFVFAFVPFFLTQEEHHVSKPRREAEDSCNNGDPWSCAKPDVQEIAAGGRQDHFETGLGEGDVIPHFTWGWLVGHHNPFAGHRYFQSWANIVNVYL